MTNTNYRIHHPDGRIGQPTYALSEDDEYVVAWVSQGLGESQDISIYGNPKGLRHLADLLLRVANLDQSKEDDSFHCHFLTGLNTEVSGSLPRITVGRVDEKNDPKTIRDAFPPLVPEFSGKSIVDLEGLL